MISDYPFKSQAKYILAKLTGDTFESAIVTVMNRVNYNHVKIYNPLSWAAYIRYDQVEVIMNSYYNLVDNGAREYSAYDALQGETTVWTLIKAVALTSGQTVDLCREVLDQLEYATADGSIPTAQYAKPKTYETFKVTKEKPDAVQTTAGWLASNILWIAALAGGIYVAKRTGLLDKGLDKIKGKVSGGKGLSDYPKPDLPFSIYYDKVSDEIHIDYDKKPTTATRHKMYKLGFHQDINEDTRFSVPYSLQVHQRLAKWAKHGKNGSKAFIEMNGKRLSDSTRQGQLFKERKFDETQKTNRIITYTLWLKEPNGKIRPIMEVFIDNKRDAEKYFAKLFPNEERIVKQTPKLHMGLNDSLFGSEWEKPDKSKLIYLWKAGSDLGITNDLPKIREQYSPKKVETLYSSPVYEDVKKAMEKHTKTSSLFDGEERKRYSIYDGISFQYHQMSYPSKIDEYVKKMNDDARNKSKGHKYSYKLATNQKSYLNPSQQVSGLKDGSDVAKEIYRQIGG